VNEQFGLVGGSEQANYGGGCVVDFAGDGLDLDIKCHYRAGEDGGEAYEHE
jgi:hypothetical protein